jgi:cystathionine gamma-synthase
LGGGNVTLDRSTRTPYEQGEPGPFYYQRYAHPTGVEAEARLGELEGGSALLYASGSGAIAGLVLALLQPGETIALAEGAYYGTGVLFRDLGRWGLNVVEFDQTTGDVPDAELVWLEAPSNPFLTMPALDEIRHNTTAKLVVDSTAATPVFLRPLEHGADLVVHSATKYLGGHHDVLLGAVIARDEDDFERLKAFRGLAGIVAAPDPCWLLLRSLLTLELRVRRQSESAADLARRLEGHPQVEVVRYPGFGGLLSFDVRGDAAAVETGTRLIENATSLGGVRSNIETRHRWEGDRVPRSLLRLSVGLEDVEELWRDLDQALKRA